jgi:ribonuclease HI
MSVSRLILFSDASVDTKTRVGFGAYVGLSDLMLPLADVKSRVKVKQFENTSSTTLELQALLWAIDDSQLLAAAKTMQLTVYTDSQNILGLPARRSGLEQRDYVASSGKRLNNAELYQEFFRVMDQCCCQIIKVDGHKPQFKKDNVDSIFALVDKASRNALRAFNR